MILLNPVFLAKDNRGNRMYSNSLKQFKYYYVSSCDEIETTDEYIVDDIKKDTTLSVTMRETIINARINKVYLEQKLLEKYSRCIVTGIDNRKLLIASHIKPWAVSTNEENQC